MKKINSILKIGNNEYENIYAILAPMAGFTDLPFRIVCEEYGCNFTFTEMINAKALCYHDEKTTKMLDVSGQNKYVSMIREFKVRGQPKVHNYKCSYLL